MNRKRVYLVILILSAALSLAGLKTFAAACSEHGIWGANYGCFLPVLIAVWSFFKWRNAKENTRNR